MKFASRDYPKITREAYSQLSDRDLGHLSYSLHQEEFKLNKKVVAATTKHGVDSAQRNAAQLKYRALMNKSAEVDEYINDRHNKSKKPKEKKQSNPLATVTPQSKVLRDSTPLHGEKEPSVSKFFVANV